REVKLRQVITTLLTFPLDPEVFLCAFAPAPVAVRVVEEVRRKRLVHNVITGVAPQEPVYLRAVEALTHIVTGLQKRREILMAVAQVDEGVHGHFAPVRLGN